MNHMLLRMLSGLLVPSWPRSKKTSMSLAVMALVPSGLPCENRRSCLNLSSARDPVQEIHYYYLYQEQKKKILKFTYNT